MKTSQRVVYVPVDPREQIQEFELASGRLVQDIRKQFFNGGWVELHKAHRLVRIQFQDPALKKLHASLTIACDEEGLLKRLPENQRASTISGIYLHGPVVFFVENGPPLTAQALEGLLGSLLA